MSLLVSPSPVPRGGGQKLDVWSQSSQVNSGIFQRSSECLRKFRWDKNDFWLDEKGPRQHKDPHFDPQKGYKIQQFWHKIPKMPISGAIFEFCATKPRASFSGYKKDQTLRTPCGQRSLCWGFKYGSQSPLTQQPWLPQTSPLGGGGWMLHLWTKMAKINGRIFWGTPRCLRKFFQIRISHGWSEIWPQQHRIAQDRPQNGQHWHKNWFQNLNLDLPKVSILDLFLFFCILVPIYFPQL